MNGKQLKNSILQLAIQGKLVPQDPNDEPASELLKRIRKEKEQLVKEGKLKKKDLETAPISDEEKPFEIPESWVWVRLGEIISISSGDGLISKDMKDGNIPVFGGNGITGYHNECNISEPTIVIGRVGFYCGSVHETPNKAWVTDNAFITTYPKNSINKDFLIYILRHLDLGKQHNATAQPVVSGKKIYPLLFPLPPLSEQHRIVAKIEELMPLVEEYDKAQTKLDDLNAKLPEALKKSILQEAIQGKLVPQDPNDEPASVLLQRIRKEKEQLVKDGKLKKKDLVSEPITDEEKPFDIPESWEWIRLNNLALVARGGSPRPIKDYITESPNGVNWIKIGDTEKGGKYINSCAEKIKPEGVQRSRMVHPGDFLLTNSMSFGRPYITNVEGCIHDGWLVISQYYEGCDPDFLYYMLSSPFAFSLFSDKTAGAVVQNLNKDKVAESVFPLPPLEEQKRIVNKIEELFGIIK